jgi:hypothetical protein
MSTEPVGTKVEVEAEGEPVRAPVMIDLGKHRRKDIKALRSGKREKLFESVEQAVAALKSDGALEANTQTVIVLVRERSKKMKWFGG